MSVLNTLNIAADIDHSNVDPVVATRTRLLGNLGEQLKAAEAMVNGTEYRVKRHRWEVIEETGEKVRKESEVPLRKWYWRDALGQVRFCLKVGNKRLALKGDNTNIVVGEDTNLPEIIQVCMKAVENGELDKAIDKVVKARKPVGKKS